MIIRLALQKDKTSILITAREYVNSLKSKVCDLEEKNKALQAQLAECARAAGIEEDDAEKVEIQITRAAADREDGTTASEVCTVKIAARPAHGNTMDVVLRTLQCLNDQMGEDDVSLVAMSTSDGDAGNGLTGAFLTMQLKVIHFSYSFLYIMLIYILMGTSIFRNKIKLYT